MNHQIVTKLAEGQQNEYAVQDQLRIKYTEGQNLYLVDQTTGLPSEVDLHAEGADLVIKYEGGETVFVEDCFRIFRTIYPRRFLRKRPRWGSLFLSVMLLRFR